MPHDQDHHPFGDSRHSELIRLRRRLIRLQDRARLLRRDVLQNKYNPDQPRVPAGNSGGGQWTSGGGGAGDGSGLGSAFGAGGGLAEFAPDGGTVFDTSGNEAWSSFNEGWSDDGSIFERDIVNRDGSTIQSEYAASRAAGFDERHTVTLDSGEKVNFETTDRTQTIRYGGPDGEIVGRSIWTASGPELDATVQPAYVGSLLRYGQSIVAGGAILFGWQSQQNGIGGDQAVMGFNAREYRPSAPGALDLSLSGKVTQEEAVAACKYLPDMQKLLDDEVGKAGSINDYPSAAAYGTYVHKRMEARISDGGFLDLHAERSYLKAIEEGKLAGEAPYGQAGTVRIDAIEYRPDGTVCVYDFKTGRAGVGPSRSYILGRAAYFSRLTRNRAIVMEVRPSKR